MTDNKNNFSELTETSRPLSLYLAAFSMTPDDLKSLGGKRILLIGGGRSPIARDLHAYGIRATVVNVDPFTNGFSPDNANELIEKSFFDTNFKEDIAFWVGAIRALRGGGNLRVAGFGHKREAVGIDYTIIPSIPKTGDFLERFNKAFPKNKIIMKSDLYVLSLDAGGVKRNPPSIDKYFELEAAAKKLSSAKSKSKQKSEMTLLQKTNKHYIFNAPNDKTDVGLFLQNVLSGIQVELVKYQRLRQNEQRA